MVGILVHGNNHFILSGPLPDEATALALVRQWAIVQIGEAKSSSFRQWEIRSKEFRENLEWAVVVPGDRDERLGAAGIQADADLQRGALEAPDVGRVAAQGSLHVERREACRPARSCHPARRPDC